MPRRSTGSAAAYVTLKGGSGRCTTSVLKAKKCCGIPLSSANGTPTEAFLFVSCILDWPRCCVCNSSVEVAVSWFWDWLTPTKRTTILRSVCLPVAVKVTKARSVYELLMHSFRG